MAQVNVLEANSYSGAASAAFREYLLTANTHAGVNDLASFNNDNVTFHADVPWDSPAENHSAGGAKALAYIWTGMDFDVAYQTAGRLLVTCTTRVRVFRKAEGSTALLAAYRLVDDLTNQIGVMGIATSKAINKTAGGQFDWGVFYANASDPLPSVDRPAITVDAIEDEDAEMAIGDVLITWTHDEKDDGTGP